MNKLELIRQEMMHVRGQAECIYHDADAFLDAVDRMENVNPDAPEVAGYLLRAIELVRSATLGMAGSNDLMWDFIRGVENGPKCAASDGV